MAEDDALRDSAVIAAEIADTLTVSASSFSRVLRAGLKDAVIEGRGLNEVLRSAALSLSNRALTTGLRPLTNLVSNGLNAVGGKLAGAAVGALSGAGTKVVPFAEGGVIGAPTAFGLGGGRTGLMGEAGREAILPLARGTDGRLGVAMEGQGSGPRVTINVTTPDAESFRRSEAQMTAMLARAVGRGRRGL
ncbi:phage tail tape measure protein [Acuticoccus sp. MNP-M23]|uniref:phage tail tape measure protein n=1 Tax=Acuticoccus sp. MNP-M23 TaxID=3072793 RepID=UPI0028169A3D|nr:phage tail tape measure protein [Acuticoccus sp. MNP-M23]WMS41699.1 phage tail tape measure protein [Acuticoccus sp. MNP-M23]